MCGKKKEGYYLLFSYRTSLCLLAACGCACAVLVLCLCCACDMGCACDFPGTLRKMRKGATRHGLGRISRTLPIGKRRKGSQAIQIPIPARLRFPREKTRKNAGSRSRRPSRTGTAPRPNSGAIPFFCHWETQELRPEALPFASRRRRMKFLRFPMEKARERTGSRSWRGCSPFDYVSNRYSHHLVDIDHGRYLHVSHCEPEELRSLSPSPKQSPKRT